MRKKTILNSYLKVLLMACCSIGMPAWLLATSTEKAMVPGVTQQLVTISGTITDESGMELTGVNIVEKGSTNGTMSDLDGKFRLSVLPGAVIQFSYIGYVSQELKVSNQQVLTVVLKEDSRLMSEVVVIGYGTQKKGDVTSAVSSVKSESFVKGAVLDAGQLVQGKVAGLSITSPSGDPTANTQIMLRGTTTLKAGSQPLILVDGVPGTLTTVAPEDIESIDVLKDGSAAAIYGSRGSNGVILITTKRVVGEMPPTIDYNGYMSVSTIKKKIDMLDASDVRRLASEGYDFVTDLGAETDWMGEVTRVPVSHVHNVSLKGGSARTNYIFSLNYRDLNGIFKNSSRNSLTLRADINHSMFNEILRINAGLINSNVKRDGIDGLIYRQALIRNPTDRIYQEDGDYQERDLFQYYNPVAMLNEYDKKDEIRYMRWNGNIIFNPIDNLNFKLLVSTAKTSQNYGYAATKAYPTTIGINSASRSATDRTTDLLEFTSDYRYSLKEHTFTVLGGYSFEKEGYDYMYMYNRDFPSDLYSFNNIGLGNALKEGSASMKSERTESKRVGFLGRLTYNYADKYLVMASIRHEGSSKFGTNHKWGTFPAVSLGWRMNRELFLQGIEAIDDLKLRAGLGLTGTEPDDPYLSLTQLSYSGYVYSNGQWINQITPASNPNPDLKWERKKEWNFGLDYSFLNGRINGAIDYYIRHTTDMLWNFSVPVPPYLYSSMTANVGVMDNKGFEFLINIIPVRTKDFEWQTSVNFSTNSNKLVSLTSDKFSSTVTYFDAGHTGDPIQQTTHRLDVGKPIGNFYGYNAVDIDADGQWILRNKEGELVNFEDRTADDKDYLGNGIPNWFAGWNNSFSYKNWDLSITMRGAFDFQILNMQRMYYENPKIPYNKMKSAYDKVFGKEILTSAQEYTSYYVENGDYWKIDNITLGYTVPLKKNNIVKSARVYASALNLLTITKYKGIDPEVSFRDDSNTDGTGGLYPGTDSRDKFPTTRSFTFGVNLTF